MASTYPTSLDNFTNPTVSDYLNSTTVPHATQHSDLNDAVENLQAKVGIDSSADTDSIDYKVTDAASRITTLEAGATANAIVAYADLSARTAANPSPSEGDVSWQEDTNRFDIYNGSAWVEVGGGGLVLINQTTVGSAVGSVTMSSVFSATYDTYLVVINGVTGSATAQIELNFDAVTTAYYGAMRGINESGSVSDVLANNIGHVYVGQVGTVVSQNSAFYVGGPFANERTSVHGTWNRQGIGGFYQGTRDAASSHSSFTIAPSTGTITGGTISTFGVVKS